MGHSIRILSILLCLGGLATALTPRSARGDHGSPWLVASPDPAEGLPLNGHITLFADNGPHPDVVDCRTNEYRLVADTGTVPLAVTRFHRGSDWNGYGKSSIVLVPRQPLLPLTLYRLEVRPQGGEWESPHIAAPVTGPNAIYGGPAGGALWTTSATADRTRPRWLAAPFTEPDSSSVEERNIIARISDTSAITFRVRATSGRRTVLDEVTYHQEVFGIQEGCHWLSFDQDVPAIVSITAIDAAGNEAPSMTIAIGAGERGASSLCLRRE